MLATNFWMPTDHHLPRRPSPLSPRSANACPQFSFAPSMSTGEDAPLPFSKRPVRANPAIQSRDAVKEKRRDMFLKRVQQDREERRWEGRGEQVGWT